MATSTEELLQHLEKKAVTADEASNTFRNTVRKVDEYYRLKSDLTMASRDQRIAEVRGSHRRCDICSGWTG